MERKRQKKSSVRNSRDSSAKHRPGPPRRRSLQRRRGNSNVLVRGNNRSGQLDDVRDDVRGKVAEGRRRLAARVVTAGIVTGALAGSVYLMTVVLPTKSSGVPWKHFSVGAEPSALTLQRR